MLIGFTLTLIFSSIGAAAPFPATSTSLTISKTWGLFSSALGFQVDARGSSWRIEEPPKDEDNIAIMFRQPGALGDAELLMTVRTDETAKIANRAAYMKRWNSTYQRLGFRVLANRDLSLGKNEITMLDLVNSEKNRQLRQFIFFRKPNTVILTCSDHVSRFHSRVNECDQLAKSLNWTEGIAPRGLRTD